MDDRFYEIHELEMKRRGNMRAIPTLVKWAGGKRRLIKQIETYFPLQVDRYFEPFLGGGAVAFHIIRRYHPQEVHLSDINEELINAYSVVQADVGSLIKLLKGYRERHSKKTYYEVREADAKLLSDIQRAARFIYLNRTCFNGLYRVNSQDQFNVPMGSFCYRTLFSSR